LSVEGRFKITRRTGNGKNKADLSGIWSRKLLDPNDLEKREPKLSVRLNGAGREERGFEILNEVPSMRRC
jgi:hypothetical protein